MKQTANTNIHGDPLGAVWPELWALWRTNSDEQGVHPGWVMAGVGVCEGPEVYWTESDALAASRYNEEQYEITSVPKRIYALKETP